MVSFEQFIVDSGLVTALDIERASSMVAPSGQRLSLALVRLGLIGEDDLARAISEQFDIPQIGRDQLFEASDEREFNVRFLRRRSVVPLGTSDGRTCIAMADPFDEEAKAALRFAVGENVDEVVATFSDVAAALARRGNGETASAETEFEGDATEEDLLRLLEDGSEAPVVRTVQRLIADAAQRRASDIHIEPMARSLVIRFRIDGQLTEVERLSEAFAGPIARRIKVMSSLDIAESRLPQDGRLRATVRGRDVDVRVSTSPTAWGESIVLRLLARTEVPLDLDRLGLPEKALGTLLAALDRPNGIVLVTGPTGSGKTTTLYAALSRLRRPEVKILTVEDPVEILIEGVNQVQVRPEIDLSYAATLRAFLRQDPDILMIGEIRDQETAEIAMRAALTGHLVLSTLHTNSALGAFTRLADIGVEPYLTASTVLCSVAQRLVRRLCPDCASYRPPSSDERSLYALHDLARPEHVAEPVGCRSCQGSGYQGRVPLIEIVEVGEMLREHIRAGTTEQAAALQDGSDTLFAHGLSLVARGETSLAEVRRAAHAT